MAQFNIPRQKQLSQLELNEWKSAIQESFRKFIEIEIIPKTIKNALHQ